MVSMTGEPVSGGVPGWVARRRWMYSGDPDVLGSRDWLAKFNHLARPAYMAARAGSLDAEMAFDLATFLATEDQPDPLATKLAEQAVTVPDRDELSKLALQVLATNSVNTPASIKARPSGGATAPAVMSSPQLANGAADRPGIELASLLHP